MLVVFSSTVIVVDDRFKGPFLRITVVYHSHLYHSGTFDMLKNLEEVPRVSCSNISRLDEALLGWQITIAQTAKTAAGERLFPSLFAKVNRMDAPVVGMIVMGIVQTLLALSTISPSLSEQFSVLVNLAVVTNVIPYIIALSALMVIMRNAGVPQGTYRLNTFVALIGMLYSTYAIYASGATAVIGGAIVLALAFIIWGFLAHRFTPGPTVGAARVS